MRALHLVLLIGAFWFIGQYSKSFEVPVAVAQSISQARKPASIKELLKNLTANKARGYILQNGTYTKVELEPGQDHMVFRFFLRDNTEKKFLVYNLSSTDKDPSSIVGTFTQGSLLYLTYNQRTNKDRVYSGWIVSPDRSQASPVAVIESVSDSPNWPSEFDVNPYLQPLN